MTEIELLELAAKAAGLINYDPITGSMKWNYKQKDVKDSTRWNARYADKECGTVDDKGYRRILFRLETGAAVKIRAHRLAWFITYGAMPLGEIDHINQDKLDNRLANLRDVSKDINQRNGTRKRNNTSGVPGVTWHKQHKKWYAQANILGVHYSIGLFKDLSEAGNAAKEFRAKHGFTENHGGIL